MYPALLKRQIPMFRERNAAMTFMERMLFQVILTISTILPLMAEQCLSRYICRTSEVNYIAMESTANVYLNATPITTHNVTNIPDCQRHCVKHSLCQSLNIKNDSSESLICQLLKENFYSENSSLVADNKSVHLYIPSKCKNIPCLNGGTCTPQYRNDNYTCKCKSTSYAISSGRNCEKSLTGLASAFLHWSFDNPDKMIPATSSEVAVSAYVPYRVRIGYEPGRKTPVLICIMGVDDGACTEFPAKIPCLTDFATCGTTASYSLWIKFAEEEVARARQKFLLRNYAISSSFGVNFYARAASKDGFDFEVSLTSAKRWSISSFGKNITRTRWNHFVLTVDDIKGLCAYVNGQKNICGGTTTSVSLSTTTTVLRVGGGWFQGAAPSIYIDDLAIWKAVLTADDVKDLFQRTKR